MTLRRFEIYSFSGPQEAVEGFAEASRDCSRFIPEVLHSAIGRFRGRTALNFAWEQAFASPEAYQRYMEHPYHAARLDRYLMIDSPECIATYNHLGVGLIGYRCEPREYFLASGARRVIALRLAPGAEDAFGQLTQEYGRQDAMSISLFRPNDLGRCWFDGETIVDPQPPYSHVWEQGFPSLAAARAFGEPWREPAEGMIEAQVEVVYELEPGYGYLSS